MKDSNILYLHPNTQHFIHFKIIHNIILKILSGLSQLSWVGNGRWYFRVWKKAQATTGMFKTGMASL